MSGFEFWVVVYVVGAIIAAPFHYHIARAPEIDKHGYPIGWPKKMGLGDWTFVLISTLIWPIFWVMILLEQLWDL